MADVTITPQQIDRAGDGLDPSRSSLLNTADTHLVRNDGRVFLWLKNTDIVQHTATIESIATRGGLAIADLSVAVPASGDRFVGPFPKSIFNDGSGDIKITFADATGMELGAFHL